MQVEFGFDNPTRLTPAAMARMLIDLDGLFFFAVALDNESLLEVLRTEPIEKFDYEQLIYLGSEYYQDDPKYEHSKYYSKISLERASYNSPPIFKISLTASLNCQKIVNSVLEFVKFILTLREHKEQMDVASFHERQKAIAKEIENASEVAALLERIGDHDVRDRLKIALVNRIEPLTNGRDYPRLKKISIKKPF